MTTNNRLMVTAAVLAVLALGSVVSANAAMLAPSGPTGIAFSADAQPSNAQIARVVNPQPLPPRHSRHPLPK
jgi:hypothetical protein